MAERWKTGVEVVDGSPMMSAQGLASTAMGLADLLSPTKSGRISLHLLMTALYLLSCLSRAASSLLFSLSSWWLGSGPSCCEK